MSKKLKGTLLGIACSLVGVVLWIITVVYLDVIAGFESAVMVIAFILMYRLINPSDKSSYVYIVGGILVLVEIVFSELISLVILAGNEGVSLSYALQFYDVQLAVMYDIGFGIVVSFLAFLGFIAVSRKTAMTNPNAVVAPLEEPSSASSSKETTTLEEQLKKEEEEKKNEL